MLNNQDFASLRAKSLGGSDIGAVLGLSKYKTAVDVWMEKTGKPIKQTNSLPLRFGQYAEEFVAKEYALATGLHLIKHEEAVIHPSYDYIHGHIDRYVQDNPSSLFTVKGSLNATRILECKTANPFAQSEWGESGSDQVPMSYLVQCIWYMMITNINQADLAVLFGNADFRIYEIQRDHELETMILEKAINFWENHVLKDIPPAASNETDYKQLFAQSIPSKTTEASNQSIEIIKQLTKLNLEIALKEYQVSELKQQIMAEMKDAEVLSHEGQTIATWKAPKPSFRLDSKKLMQEHPELANQYQVAIQNSRRLTIKDLL